MDSFQIIYLTAAVAAMGYVLGRWHGDQVAEQRRQSSEISGLKFGLADLKRQREDVPA